MTKARLSIHEAAAALLRDIHAPRGTVTTMVDIDEKKGKVIRVLVVPDYRHVLLRLPDMFMGYPVVSGSRPSVHAFGSGN